MYEEIERLLLERDDEDARLRLVQLLNPLIISSIKRYCPLWRQYDDLLQDGIVVVLECVDMYDPERGYFLGFVKSYLKFYFLKTFKYLLMDEEHISSVEEETWEEFVSDDEDMEQMLLREEFSGEIKEALALLTKRQREVVVMYYFLDMSLIDIATSLGIKRWTVINTKRRSMEILRRFFDVN
ncbi:MAG: sigma-70 family RNA polymerase sigma factor [Peptoniphilus sp.]|nr:sigma-70 family RNA polymerase sigma factor [Peptoniphilus sp.]